MDLDLLKYAFVKLSLFDATTVVSGSEFSTNLGSNPDLASVKAVKLISASVPNLAYNVSSHKGNNVFTYNDGVAIRAVTVANGQYTTATLMTALKTQMDSASAPSVVTITQSTLTNLITMSISANTLSTVVGSQSSLNYTLGFCAISSASASITAGSLPSLTGDNHIYIHSENLSNNKCLIGSTANSGRLGGQQEVNIAWAIPVTVPWGEDQGYTSPEETSNLIQYLNPVDLRTIKIVLRGCRGHQLTNIGVNSNPVIFLKIYY